MKILLSWLREFVPVEQEPRALATDLSMLGFAVDSLTSEGGETVFEIDVTTNRPDCLSHYGLAREVAARYGLPLVSPRGDATVDAEMVVPATAPKPRARRKDAIVEITAPDLCWRYSARLIRGVQVKPSPDWLARRLELVGVRSINNVADATNYILMGYGHPMHAFDLDKLAGGRIIVRRASENESFTTLDGVARTLTTDDLVIADGKRAVALAGVMGGLDSEISASTTNVLLESAWFAPVAVRRTSKRQGLHTEASHRFERGADIEATLPSAERCIQLIHELAGGEIDPLVVDAYAKPTARHTILLHHWELSRHLGLDIPPEEVERILYALGFQPRAKGRTGWTCTVPSHRVDVTREIDLIEEVARHYGYDRFPLRLPPSPGEPAHLPPDSEKQERVRELLLALGYDETISMGLVSRTAETYGEFPAVPLANPLSEEAAVLRTSLVPGVLAALQWNLNRGQHDLRLFEIGHVYSRDREGFREPLVLTLAATGTAAPAGMNDDGRPRNSQELGFFDVKGDISQVVGLFALNESKLTSDKLPAFFRPGHAANLFLDNVLIARFGELGSTEAQRRKFRRPVYVAEIFLDVLCERHLRTGSAVHSVFALFAHYSRFPAVERDFSVVVSENTTFGAIRNAIDDLNIAEIIDVRPVEVFRGEAAGARHYSILVRVTLQSYEATLTEADLTERSARIIQALEARLGAKIRMTG